MAERGRGQRRGRGERVRRPQAGLLGSHGGPWLAFRLRRGGKSGEGEKAASGLLGAWRVKR